MNKIITALKTTGQYKDKLGTYKLLPRRKGRVYGLGYEKVAVKKFIYSKRIRFTPSKEFKDMLCK